MLLVLILVLPPIPSAAKSAELLVAPVVKAKCAKVVNVLPIHRAKRIVLQVPVM